MLDLVQPSSQTSKPQEPRTERSSAIAEELSMVHQATNTAQVPWNCLKAHWGFA
jgi:hypothetical protein